jgi:hypothetical protein
MITYRLCCFAVCDPEEVMSRVGPRRHGGGGFGNFMLVDLEKDGETFLKWIRGVRIMRTRVGWNGLGVVWRGRWTLDFNLLKPSGYYMYRTVVTICTTSLTFTNSTFCPHSVFVCFVWIWEQTAIISLYSIIWLVFITETECVYCAVRTECWTVFHVN